MYECHITTMVSQAKQAAKIAEELHWKTSEIARDPLLGNDTYFYLTSHGATYDTIYSRMQEVKDRLYFAGVNVVREKIEHIVYDVRR